MPIPSSRPVRTTRLAVALDGERERRAGPGVADRVLREVPRDHPQHARTDRELDVVVAFEPSSTPGARGALAELLERLLEHRLHRRRAERDDARARLELAQEQHLVDELRDLVDLAARLLDERGHVLARQRRRLEEREQPRERRPQLVRDGGSEPRAELLVRGEVALAREVDEPLAAAAHLVRHDERDDARARRVRRSPGSGSPSRRPSTACRARRLAWSTRSASSSTTIASRLSSTSTLPRIASASVTSPRSNRRFANRLRRAHGDPYSHVGECMRPRKGERMKRKALRSCSWWRVALIGATAAASRRDRRHAG